MSWLLFLSITILIKKVSSQLAKEIPSNPGFWEDEVGQEYQNTSTPGDYWYYPEYNPNRANNNNNNGDGTGGLGHTTSTFNQQLIWGWWRHWGYTNPADGQWVSDPEGRSMLRYFKCMSYSNVNITLDLYMCATSSTTITYKRAQGSGVGPLTLEIVATRGNNNWINWGGTIPSGADCSANVKRWQVSDTFTTSGSGDFWYIKINWRGDVNQNVGQSKNTVGFNNLRIECQKIITPGPTMSPTATTKAPSKSPSKTPSETPSSTPSKTPSGSPSKTPTTHFPTKSPTTPIPSKAPSIPPTTDPTQSPTTDPTADPTPDPTPRPVAKPTDPPTVKKSLGDQFGEAFGGSSECTDGWVACNTVVFIILLLLVIFCLLYWILGGVWYKRRQDNRPLPPYLMNQDQNENNVEMGTSGTGVATHTTANKWKSAWEQEQEQQQQQQPQQGDGW